MLKFRLIILVGLLFGFSSVKASELDVLIERLSTQQAARDASGAEVAHPSVSIAKKLLGIPYRWGGTTAQGGFDCSGLIVYVYNKAAGIKLPRTIQQMSSKGRSIDDQPPAPGDLVFFNTTGEKYSHAGIYVGQGRFVHAPSAGGTVRLDYITTPYWAAKFTEARRLIPQ